MCTLYICSHLLPTRTKLFLSLLVPIELIMSIFFTLTQVFCRLPVGAHPFAGTCVPYSGKAQTLVTVPLKNLQL